MTAMAMAESDTAPDGQLAARARDGDRAAFAALVERHYDFIFRVAFRLCGHRAEAEDIAHEVCVRLGRAIAGYRGGAAFTTWLYAIVLNAARDARRRSEREAARAQAFGLHAALAAAGNEADDPADALWDAVRHLPDKQREAVTLVYGEGLSHAQAADVMAVSETTVSWHVHEAKKRLKALLRPVEEQ
jgi:RNA polymerase sigma-70 factor (ECF subfamily)